MKLSWRHHYIPKFYLKGFTNEEGFFYLYNKQKKAIESIPKSPESYFFERNRNTFLTPSGELDDFIETSFYKQVDNLSKYAFEKLRNEGLSSINDNAKALISILQFLNAIFYRIPKYDEFHNQEILNGNSKYFLPIYKGDHVNVSREYYEAHKNEDLYRYACRFFLSLQGIIPVGDELNKWTVLEFPIKTNQILVTSDCPIIINDENLYNTGQEIVFCPLTERHIVLRTNSIRENINVVELIYFVNIYLIAIADKYVCSSRREILDFYIQRYKNFDVALIKRKIISLVSTTE